MKILKRIIYTLLGLLIAGTVVLIGVILYAEYSGNRFHPDSVPALAQLELSNEESRLAYDENGNLLETPTPENTENASDTSEASSAEDTSDGSNDVKAASMENAVNSSDVSTMPPADDAATPLAPVGSSSDSASSTNDEPELSYVMDLGSALFHMADCPYAANIAADKRSEMTTTSSKIIDAGYAPCSNCRPDAVAAAAANAAHSASPTLEVSNELNH